MNNETHTWRKNEEKVKVTNRNRCLLRDMTV
jgi:hypothetical protein